jgi:hypothetical protein
MMQSSNGDCPKRKGNYTGERLKLLRPDTYRRIVRLLAEPREFVRIIGHVALPADFPNAGEGNRAA